jgi:hypothetical protein
MENNNDNAYKMQSSLSWSYLPSANPSPIFQRQLQQPLHKTVKDQYDDDNPSLDKLLTVEGLSYQIKA